MGCYCAKGTISTTEINDEVTLISTRPPTIPESARPVVFVNLDQNNTESV